MQGAGLILFCTRCRAYAWRRAQQLRHRCQGSAAGRGLLLQRDLLARGLFPKRHNDGLRLGPSRLPTPAAADWLAWQLTRPLMSRHAAFDQPTLRQCRPSQLLSCFGLDEDTARLQALRTKRLGGNACGMEPAPQSDSGPSSEEELW